jgi:hypothetical protein
VVLIKACSILCQLDLQVSNQGRHISPTTASHVIGYGCPASELSHSAHPRHPLGRPACIASRLDSAKASARASPLASAARGGRKARRIPRDPRQHRPCAQDRLAHGWGIAAAVPKRPESVCACAHLLAAPVF